MNNFASVPTPIPSDPWPGMTPGERKAIAQHVINICEDPVLVVDTKADGQIIVSLLDPVPAAKRGTLLLDCEEYLNESICRGLTVWLEAAGDKNPLRKLRGIEIKHE